MRKIADGLQEAREPRCPLRPDGQRRMGFRVVATFLVAIMLSTYIYNAPGWLLRAFPFKRMLCALFVGALCFGGYFYYAYKGFVTDLVADLRYGSLAETKNKYAFFLYYAGFYEKLRINPETGLYDLRVAMEESRKDPNQNDFERGKLSYHEGDFAAAIAQIEADIQKRGETESKLFWLAMSHLRSAETENCLARLTGSAPFAASSDLSMSHDAHDMSKACVLPVTIFQDKPQGAEAAARVVERLLDNYDSENKLYRWLLNFSYMTINRFPQGVPPKYLIKSDFIDSFYGEKRREREARYSYLSFEDRARELGVDTLDAGKGVAVEDFNGDGYLDIITGGTFSALKYYQNDRGLRFIDRTAQAGLSQATQAYMITAADYDNDGRMDVFVGRPFQRFTLYHNNGDATFTDVTLSSGLLAGEPAADQAIYTCVSAWADVNNDGSLDLFIAQFGQRLPFVGGLLARQPMSSKLFINEHGRFVDRTEAYGLKPVVEDSIYIGATFGDYDADGWPDLFISSVSRHRSMLLRNVGGQRFERTDLIAADEPGFTATFVDVNQDGQLDIFQGSQGTAIGDTARAVFGEHVERNNNKIFLQNHGRFETRSDLFGDYMSLGTMGASYGDINNDGCYDFYLGKGTPESWFILPNMMYLGDTDGVRCTGHMTNISMLQGFGTIQKGHAIVFFDFDNDGDQDIYSSLGGMWPGDAWPNQLFVNNSKLENSWIKIRLRGRETNYYGVGARIKVVAENEHREEIVRYYQMDNKTGFGSAADLAHIGLLSATRLKEIQVYWPVSGETKTYAGTLKQLNLLDEDQGAVVPSAPGGMR